MKPPDQDGWRRTSPFAILFFIGRLFRQIAKNAWQSLAPLLALAVAGGGSMVDRLKIGAAIFIAVVLVAAALRYWFFRFHLAEDSVLIREGVFKKKQRDIKFDRIQGINAEQNVVYRLFGLVTLTFDTAGSSGDEGQLPAVSREFADSLRRKIGHHAVRSDAEADVDHDEPAPESLLRLRWPDMLRIGLADKRALVVLAVLGPVLDQLGDEADTIIKPYVEEAAQGLVHFGAATGILIGIGVLAGVLLLLALGSIGAAFWRYHDFELFLDGSTLRSYGGLLTKHEVSMDLGKIQTLRLHQGLILRAFLRYRLSARQARAGRSSNNSHFTVPIVTGDDADELRERLLGAEGRGLVQQPHSPSFAPVSPQFMRVPMLLAVLLPVLGVLALLVASGDPAVLLVAAGSPLAAYAIYRTWRHAGYLYTDHGFVRRRGMIGYTTVALLYRKVQRVTVSQSPRQRRKRLATLRVYMASGSVKIPYIEESLAQTLRDYILYKVESSRRAWH